MAIAEKSSRIAVGRCTIYISGGCIWIAYCLASPCYSEESYVIEVH